MLIALFSTIVRQSVHRGPAVRLLDSITRTKLSYATMSGLTIGTHDGCFHCDEALACFMLKLLPRYKDAKIVRSRDKSILDTCDMVVDVGGEYDPSKHRYDHHMRDFKDSQSTVMKKPGYDSTIKLSSAGLIYCHFGQEVIREILPKEVTDKDVEIIFKKVYDSLIKEVDAIDNGIPISNAEPLYFIKTDLASRVDRLNPAWNSEGVNIDERFLKAVDLTGEEFTYFVNHAANVWLPARSIVEQSLAKRFEVDPSGEIVELSQFVVWSEHLFNLEKELNITPTIKYIIFKDGVYRIRAVPVAHGSFIGRMFLPEAWAGLRGEALSNVCGIDGAEFVHSVRFIGGHKTREGALAMARKALEIGKSL